MAKLMVSGKEIPVDDGITIEQAVTGAGMHPDSYLYLIGGRPVPMDTVLRSEDAVKVMRVASGG